MFLGNPPPMTFLFMTRFGTLGLCYKLPMVFTTTCVVFTVVFYPHDNLILALIIAKTQTTGASCVVLA
jgi:hypothetical protein